MVKKKVIKKMKKTMVKKESKMGTEKNKKPIKKINAVRQQNPEIKVKQKFCPKCGCTDLQFFAGEAPIMRCNNCKYTSPLFPEREIELKKIAYPIDTIDFLSIENKWQEAWEKERVFQVKEDKKKKKYYVLEMFPYPSASYLHMGHVRNYSIGDVIARYQRMQGFNVLYPMGYDSFGLPAENAAKKEGIHPKIYTERSIAQIMSYQKKLGLSYDWSRIITTHTPDYYKWNQWFFLKFFEHGLAYKKQAPVNWCPSCKTVLANEEVIEGKCWRCDSQVDIKQLEQWFFKTTDYAEELLKDIDKLDWSDKVKAIQKNWIGKSKGIMINFKVDNKEWPVFTTRPDTIYGVTFMAISLQHPKLLEMVKDTKYEKDVQTFIKKSQAHKDDVEWLEKEGVFTGKYAVNPVTNEKIPIYAANFVIADYATGMVMAVPAHDQRDFEFAKKFKIPIKEVIQPKNAGYMVIEKSLPKEKFAELNKYGQVNIEKIDKDWGKFARVIAPVENENQFVKFLEKNLLSRSEDGGAWYSDSINTTNTIVFPNKHFVIKNQGDYEEYLKYGLKLKIPKKQLEKNIKAFTESGKIINSRSFDGLNSAEAIEKISDFLEKQGQGKRTFLYKLRDWLISRQRYWGTPIPIVYCEKCGPVPVSEKDLPVLLPEDVDFKGAGNPLLTSKDFLETTCPRCKGKAKRETDTMGGFMDSSWYFLRYCDAQNTEKPFEKEKVDYWMPVNQYVGGIEHAVGHLIYARFFTKVLRDLGMLSADEPFTKLFNQGVVYKDGKKMSKSYGNTVTQDEISKKYGVDTARLFLLFVSAPQSDMEWTTQGIEGMSKFIKKVYLMKDKEQGNNKTQDRIESMHNKTIQDITEDIKHFRFNLAIIKIMKFADYLDEQEFLSKEAYLDLIKTLSLFCPHICEEIWHDPEINQKGFVSSSSWPKADEKKINQIFEEQEKAMDVLVNDVNNILRIVKEKNIKEKQNITPKKIFIYVLPKELPLFQDAARAVEKSTGLGVQIFAVNDKSKYDPQFKASKAKPGKPAIYLD
ncbi:MAG: class I tRNA ligase family protein [Candidatus Pacearchaeota archaeon]|nr:class I tRNA ligase family protein [Candidatus Pacearchaeota archaeon]